METISGKITRILFKSPETNYTVLELISNKGRSIVTGEFTSGIIPEIHANFHGEYKTHPKYGSQFRALSHDITFDKENLPSIKVFLQTVADWIGPERAEAIVSHFGGDTVKILDESPERLMEVEGIGKVSSESLIEAWKKSKEEWDANKEIYSCKALLFSLGIKEKRANRIIKHLGGFRAEEKLKENPYIIAELDDFGFTTADFVAKSLGIAESSPDRLEAFIFYLINKQCSFEGHLFYTLDDILQAINKYIKDTGVLFIEKGSISQTDIAPHIKALTEKEKIIEENNCVYSKNSHYFETRSANILAHIMSTPSDLIMLNRATVDEHIEKFEKQNLIELSLEQREALYCFAEQKVFVITGAPGTGKTTVLKAIVDVIQQLGLELTAVTPTGISAKKLAETIEFDAFTVHRRLGYRGNLWIHNENNLFNTDIVIVDETSMLDQETLFRLLSALHDRTHIIFVGDHNQLPSVGAGNVLKELVNCGGIPVVKLEKIFRQNEASDIIKAAHKIKNGDPDLELFKHDPAADIFFMRKKEVEDIEKVIIALAGKFKDEKRSFQIITPRNEGPCSVDTLNKILQAVLNPPHEDMPELLIGRNIIRRGDRIIITKNDYEREIYNGDIGKVLNISGGQVSVQIDDRNVDISIEEASTKIKLAYAITVHKSQGLEYPFIILPMINQFGRLLLQRNLLYTAITRAKKKVIVLGHGSALEKAINNASVIKRNTNLGQRINECLVAKKKYSSPPSLEEQESYQNVQSLREPSLSKTENCCQSVIIEE